MDKIYITMKNKTKHHARLISTLFFSLVLAASATAQDTWVNRVMPFIPQPASSPLRCVKQYQPTTRNQTPVHSIKKYKSSEEVMRDRKLVALFRYDRHGHITERLDTLGVLWDSRIHYDAQGRLVGRLVRERREDAVQMARYDTISWLRVGYDSEGLVSDLYYADYYHRSFCIDTTVKHLSLQCTERDEASRLISCMYLFEEEGSYTHYDGTIVFERQYDSLGHLLREACVDYSPEDFRYQTLYTYDEYGRVLYEKTSTNWTSDSLCYHYTDHYIEGGGLIEKSGKSWDAEGYTSDITITYRFGNIPYEEVEIMYMDDDFGSREVNRTFYDKYGNKIRTERNITYEYDNEYWEDN